MEKEEQKGKNWLIGNGYDASRGVHISFSEFIKSEYGEQFKNYFSGYLEGNLIVVTYTTINSRDGLEVDKQENLIDILREDINWNKWEQILGYTWKVSSLNNFNNSVYYDEIKNMLEKKRVDIEFLECANGDYSELFVIYFKLLFEEYFEQYFLEITKNLKISKDEKIGTNDVIINLNYTDLHNEYKNVHKVHQINTDKKINIIDSAYHKNKNNHIKGNLDMVPLIKMAEVHIFGVHLHDVNGVVDGHILSKISESNPSKIIYENLNLNEYNISCLRKNLGKYFDEIDITVIDNGKILEYKAIVENKDDGLPF